VGLFAASFLGLRAVPLTSAYATCEACGWETGTDWDWGQAPAFYGLRAFFVGCAALFVLIPGLPLIAVMFLSQGLDGLLVPIILVFVFLLAGKRRVLGSLVSGRALLGLGWLVTVAISVMSVALVSPGSSAKADISGARPALVPRRAVGEVHLLGNRALMRRTPWPAHLTWRLF
jgi:Mn2+/Fe2+ NRAMP family transporter